MSKPLVAFSDFTASENNPAKRTKSRTRNQGTREGPRETHNEVKISFPEKATNAQLATPGNSLFLKRS